MIPAQAKLSTRTILITLTLILGAAAVLRLLHLETAPAGGHGDVAWIGINALDWIDRGAFPYYIYELYAPEPMIVQLTALMIPLVGVAHLASRWVTVIFGLLLVVLMIPAVNALLADWPEKRRQRAALLAAAAAGLSLHAAYISRLGMRAALFPALVTLTTWLTVRAWRRGGWMNWALAGASLALMQYVYIPARLFPAVLLLWWAHGWWADRERWRARWRGWFVMALVAFVLTLPNLFLFISTPEAFSARADAGSAATGGWAWQYIQEPLALLTLFAQKIWLELVALGVRWNGPYSMINLPMLTPVFFAGLIVAIAALRRSVRQIGLMWPLLALPVMFSTDLISGAVVEIHAVRQTGVLPFVFMLAGIGLALGWDWLEARNSPAMARVLPVAIAAAALIPAGLGLYQYLGVAIPAKYADPDTGWRDEQTDVDLAQRLLAEPDQAYLLPYDEYNRSNIAYLLSDQWRERRSAIDADGGLMLPDPPEMLTLVTASDPYRIRHDGRVSVWDTRLWVLLEGGTTWLLPPVSDDAERELLQALALVTPEPVTDRSGTTIASLYQSPAPPDLFAARDVIAQPAEADFALPGGTPEIRLLGYELASTELSPDALTYVTLYWDRVGPVSEDYEIFVQLWDDDGGVIAATHDFPYGGMYRTRIWQNDAVTATHHWLRTPADLGPGRYTLVTGLYRILHNEALITTGPNAAPDGRAALMPDLRLAPDQAEAGSAPSFVLDIGKLRLSGLDASTSEHSLSGDRWEVMPGETLDVALTWDVREPLTIDYSLFLHLTTADDPAPLAQADGALGAGSLPSGAWRAGDRWRDALRLTLPEDIAPGEYGLWLGVYDYRDGQRLPVTLDGTVRDDGRGLLAMIDISRP